MRKPFVYMPMVKKYVSHEVALKITWYLKNHRINKKA